jgi:hypothetical protein
VVLVFRCFFVAGATASEAEVLLADVRAAVLPRTAETPRAFPPPGGLRDFQPSSLRRNTPHGEEGLALGEVEALLRDEDVFFFSEGVDMLE